MKLFALTVFALLMGLQVMAQHEDERYVPETDPLALEKISKWQDIKFGLMMHWGPYSQWGIVESWSICSEHEGWCERKGSNNYYDYKQKYEGLQYTFNPVNFDPAKWAQAAKEAGMKYVVFTTKHHDGFCMFDTKYTDYRVTSDKTPFHTNPKANIADEVFKAFRSKDFMIGAYFSKPDWHSENYWWPEYAAPDRNVNYNPEQYPERWEKFVQFTHNQVNEIVSDYGSIDLLWFDGGWVSKKTPEEIQRAYLTNLTGNKSGYLKSQIINQDIRMDEIVANARQKQPGIIVVDRAVYGKNQNYLTPENRVPEKTLPYPWESCIIAGGGWSYSPNAKYLSGREGIKMLVDIVAKGGNLLLNIAPAPDGSWDQGAYDLLKEYGSWLKVNGEAIYNSKPLEPYKEGKVCMTQQNNGAKYFIYLSDEGEDTPPAKIWVSSVQPKANDRVTLLGSNQSLKWEKVGNGFVAELPDQLRKKSPCKFAWTIKVEPGK